MKYQMFHLSTRARHQKCNNLLAEAKSLNRKSRIYIHGRDDLSEETVKLKLCDRLHKKYPHNWSLSPTRPVISGASFTCIRARPLSSHRGSLSPLMNRGRPHVSRRGRLWIHRTKTEPTQTESERIFRGWIWRERERESEDAAGGKAGQGRWTELMGDLGVISLAWRPRWIKINYPGLSINHQEWAGQEEGSNGRRWGKICEIHGGNEWGVSSGKLCASVQETEGKSKSPFTSSLIIYVFRLLWKS